ncbi:uncharacterized protein [Physcomitrium patens]|uniref:uncharacterized protein isoform X3 n=1 Tax=Physcomitrium patens TaxID=3218 RepID=UPI000D160F60|nr:uncharacterized protein LOC112273006 isoform X2 [Physcomitrium patens]|eukprot:XP_024357155.1 uncharacterized protein LOC112273006 isoform X2 [Physcomitrella patens]
MYSMRVGRRLLCSRMRVSTFSTCHEASSLRSAPHMRGHDPYQTIIAPSSWFFQNIGSRPVYWEYYPKSLKHLQRAFTLFEFKSYIRSFLGLAVATSSLATEQGAVQCEIHDEFQAKQQGPVISEIIAEGSFDLGKEHKLVTLIKRYWWPTAFLLTVIVGYPYPMSLLPNSLLLLWTTKPNPTSIHLWLEKMRHNPRVMQWEEDEMKAKLISPATIMHVEVRDCMFFCLAKVTYPAFDATVVGVLGDWWVISSSSSRITALGLSLDNVPNIDDIAKNLKSKTEELQAEFKKATEEGLRKYRTWCEEWCEITKLNSH